MNCDLYLCRIYRIAVDGQGILDVLYMVFRWRVCFRTLPSLVPQFARLLHLLAYNLWFEFTPTASFTAQSAPRSRWPGNGDEESRKCLPLDAALPVLLKDQLDEETWTPTLARNSLTGLSTSSWVLLARWRCSGTRFHRRRLLCQSLRR